MTVLEEQQITGPRSGTRRRGSPLGSKWTPYFFLAPAALFILVFQVVPLAQEIFLSFTRTSLLNPTRSTWVGFDNFTRIFGDEDFRRTLLITLIYVVVCVVVAVGAGLAVALLLNKGFRGRGLARAFVTIPWAAPGIAVALIAIWMLNPDYGIVNRFLDAVGLGVPGGAILDSPRYALPAVLATTIWQLFPFTSVVLLSALQSVPPHLTEAATMDGAGRWWTFRAVTWQAIKPTVGLLALLMTIWSLRRFELIWLMTKGGPVGATQTLVIELYSQAFDSKQLGSAAAVGMVGVVISLIVIAGSRFVARAAEREAR
ncbi:carbohydrate ABC transporter permease [Sphaerisporangium dianthi]|uniref:Carbohydrate ABC transporter permease n=1 Tax=Sphaerisporangium dianthi TaxID=1436120 RepID=A0ABV9CH55_9ACTN